MKRSAGVTVVAVVSLLGSVLALCFGVLTGVMAFVMPRPASAPGLPPTAMLVTAGVIYFLPGVWGLLSGIGLIRLKNWARISTIVFGSLLIMVGGFTGVMVVFLSTMGLTPPDQVNSATAASVMAVMRGMMTGLAVAQLGIGIWWVVFLTRPKVAAQFTGGATVMEGTASGRPISITIIAWFMLLGVLGSIFPLVVHSPVPFFLTTFSGLPATLYLIAMIVVVAYCGVGLLRLQPMARLLAIGYFAFGLVNTAVFALIPGGHARMAALFEWQQTHMTGFVPAADQAPAPFDVVNLIYYSMAASTLLMLVPLYFLVTNKRAFESAAKG